MLWLKITVASLLLISFLCIVFFIIRKAVKNKKAKKKEEKELEKVDEKVQVMSKGEKDYVSPAILDVEEYWKEFYKKNPKQEEEVFEEETEEDKAIKDIKNAVDLLNSRSEFEKLSAESKLLIISEILKNKKI